MDYGSILAQGLRQKRQAEQDQVAQEAQAEAEANKANFQAVINSVKASNQLLLKFLGSYSPEVSVRNFPPTLDNSEVIKAIKGIKLPETDDSGIIKAIENLAKQNEAIIEAFKGLELSPQVNVKAPNVKVGSPDLSPITDAIKSIPKPEATDLSGVISRLNDNTQALAGLKESIDALPAKFPKTHVDVDPLVTYQAVDMDDAGTVKYFGFQRSGDLGWYIKCLDESGSPKTIRWATGIGGYPANWTNRASLTYARWGE